MKVSLGKISAVRANREKMFRLLEDFPNQCARAIDLAREMALPAAGEIGGVVFTGMGGSAISGDIIRGLVRKELAVPFVVNRGYDLPAHVGRDSLVFAASYSGDTEETLACYERAKEAGARVVCFASGGQLLDAAARDGFAALRVPAGLPPRAAIGYMLFGALIVMERLGMLPDLKDRMDEALEIVGEGALALAPSAPANAASMLARQLAGRLPVFYGIGELGAAIAYRWETQCNENAKSLAHSRFFPELTHNEIVAWERTPPFADVVVVLRVGNESAADRRRVEAAKAMLASRVRLVEVHGRGTGDIAQALSLIQLGDFVSVYLAELNGVDPCDTRLVEALKAELARR